jgi:hypothetical protein
MAKEQIYASEIESPRESHEQSTNNFSINLENLDEEQKTEELNQSINYTDQQNLI